MFSMPYFDSMEAVFEHLDGYARNKKDELTRCRLDINGGLIKSYVIETANNKASVDGTADVATNLKLPGWEVERIGDERFYSIVYQGFRIGYVEPFMARYLLLHSYQDSTEINQIVRSAIKSSARLDSLWLAGESFSMLWSTWILPNHAKRYVKVKFDYKELFEGESGDEGAESENDEAEDEEIVEKRVTSSEMKDRAERLNTLLSMRDRYPPLRAITMLRIPVRNERGGYDFWANGKVTYYAPSFRKGRERAMSLTRAYMEATEEIENIIWLQTETHNIRDYKAVSLTGTAATFEFSQPLEPAKFREFVNWAFGPGGDRLRLWGNPIWFGDKKVHIYGIDKHLWQRIYLEMTLQRIVAVLPQGTCGNTIHRLMTNIQGRLDPGVELYVGDLSYANLMQKVFAKEGNV